MAATACLHRHRGLRVRHLMVWNTTTIHHHRKRTFDVVKQSQVKSRPYARCYRVLYWGSYSLASHQTYRLCSQLTCIQPVIFVTFYLVYKYITPRSFRVDLRDLTPSHYVLDDLDSLEQENPNTNPRKPSNANESHSVTSPVELESPWEGPFVLGESSREWGKARADDVTQRELDLSPEMLDEVEAQRARREERQRIHDVLERRSRRWERGFWREMWSFVVVEERTNDTPASHEHGSTTSRA